MLVLDLFCGTKSISKAFEAKGHTVYTASNFYIFCRFVGALIEIYINILIVAVEIPVFAEFFHKEALSIFKLIVHLHESDIRIAA
jgi:hypothetical protein